MEYREQTLLLQSRSVVYILKALVMQMMKELVSSGNALTQLMITALAPTLPGAMIGAPSPRLGVI